MRLLAAFSLSMLLSVVPPAAACYCDSAIFENSPATITQAVAEASTVFRGTVEGLKPGGGPKDQAGPQAVMIVRHAWKGHLTEKVSVSTPLNACPLEFLVGEDYIVYALPDETGYFATACSRTRPMSQAAYDLEILDHRRASASAR